MSESIDELRERWEADPSPQLSLQLAEEYRRHDRRQEAVEVLEQALEEHPDHMAAQVALGRYRLEMGDLDDARGLLEQVAQADPTHLVASKLLVTLYIEAGEKNQARDRLDLYKLLNESDPDIESLEDQLEGRTPAPDLVEAPVEPKVVVVDVPKNGDPFRDLWVGLDSAAYWEAVGAEGIFPVSQAPKPSPPAAEPLPETGDVDEVPGATVTLANLYMQQGHLQDAKAAFDEVLEREPENSEAMAGLEEVRRLHSESLVDSPEIAEPPPNEEELGGDLGARKIQALNDYLQRIRAAEKRQ